MSRLKTTVMCKVFHCDHRGDRYCCSNCPRRKGCKNHCQNFPQKCGLSFEKKTERSKRSNEVICNSKS